MSNPESPNPIWKLISGAVIGIVLTWAYVRFGYKLPGIAQIGATVTSEAAIATAEAQFYDPAADVAARKRALATIIANQPELLIELDDAVGNRLFDELLRRKAVRQAKLLKHRDRAYDIALEKPALRKLYEKKYGVTDLNLLKRKMFIADIARNEILAEYLGRHFPHANANQRIKIVMGVYQNDLKAPTVDRTASSARSPK